MFRQLSEKLQSSLRILRGRGMLSDNHIQNAVSDIRVALLAADVHVEVVASFVARIADRARSADCIKGLQPTEQFARIVYEELTAVLGGEVAEFSWRGPQPVVILCAGLQGSGKTTTTAKLALAAARARRRPLMVPLDLARPAAVAQLQNLGRQISIEVYPTPASGDPAQIACNAVRHAQKFGFDTVYLDTAGRLAIDELLMAELQAIVAAVTPQHQFLVIDSMAGQTGLTTAKRFAEAVGITGVVLTKADGDARGGVALSISHALDRPIYYIGVGEKPEDLEKFYPGRMAARMLDMGDVASFMERAGEAISHEEVQTATNKICSGQFTLDEFRRQLRMMGKIGSMETMLKMLPGGGRLASQVDVNEVEKEFRVKEIIIDSMTASERRNPRILNGSRRVRIAKGAGRTVQEVNRLMKEFEAMQVAFKTTTRSKGPLGGRLHELCLWRGRR